MLRKYSASRFLLTVGVVNALLISSALAFQRSSPSDNNVVHQDEPRINPVKNSWSRGGIHQRATHNKESETVKTTKKGTWFRGGIRHDAKAKSSALVNK